MPSAPYDIERLCDAMQDTLRQEGHRFEDAGQFQSLRKEWFAGMQSLQVTGLAVPRYKTAGKAHSLTAEAPADVLSPWPTPADAHLKPDRGDR